MNADRSQGERSGVAASLETLAAMAPWDVRLQYRYGFYGVYAVLTVLFALVVRATPAGPARDTVLRLVLFGDPSFLGFYFVAALVLFEKREAVLDALVTSPLSTSAYCWSKALSLTVLAVLASTIVTALGYGLSLRWLPLLASVALTSVLFVFVGFVGVARFDSINAYFLTAIAYTSVLTAPVLELLGVVETPLFYLLPAKASLVLLEAAVEPVPAWELGYAVAYLLAGIGLASVAARRSVERHVVAGTADPGRQRAPLGSGVGSVGGPVTALVVTDCKNWLRDPLLLYIGVAPVLLGLAARVGVPSVTRSLAGTLDLSLYYAELSAILLLFGPTIVGFAVGFLVLEDREQGTITALRLTPLTGRGYLAYRLVVTYLVALVAAVAVVPIAGLVAVPPLELAAVAAVAALFGPVTALLLAGLSGDTIEGIAVSKFLGFLVVAPVGAIAVLPWPWHGLAGVLPAYWPALALVSTIDGPIDGWALAVGVCLHAAVLGILARRFLDRAD